MLKRIGIIQILIFSSLAFAGFAARAQETPEIQVQQDKGETPLVAIDTCRISEDMDLISAVQIYCQGKLIIDDGVTIHANGYPVAIAADDEISMGTSEIGFTIDGGPTEAINVFLYAGMSAHGHLNIKNMGEANNAKPTEVVIQYGSTHDYTQDVELGDQVNYAMTVDNAARDLRGNKVQE